MIIISQDKNVIINFDNVTGIQLDEDDKQIGIQLVNDDSLIIGEYDTKERAKKVLAEIIERYSICSPKYEMPLE